MLLISPMHRHGRGLSSEGHLSRVVWHLWQHVGSDECSGHGKSSASTTHNLPMSMPANTWGRTREAGQVAGTLIW